MNYSEINTKAYLNECKHLLSIGKLPSWDELPEIDLYMDQVIEIVNKYLSNLEIMSGDVSETTRPMINNYVKLGMMPAPVRKKYGRLHLAYIIVICTLKQSLNMSTIQKILPVNLPEEEVKYIYSSFVKNQRASFDFVLAQADKYASPILDTENADSHRIDDLLMQTAFSANIFKCLTEKMVNLGEKSE